MAALPLLLPSPSLSASLKEAESYCLKIGVDPLIVYAIAMVESPFARKGSLGTPYFFRVNSPVILRGGKLKRIGERVYYCYSKKNCSEIVSYLVKRGIKNLDLGTFQINYLYQWRKTLNRISDAFDQVEAFKIACKIVKEGLEKGGYTPYGVALYHSSTPFYNRRYALRWWKKYKELLKEKRKK